MPRLGEIPPEVVLASGESVSLVFDAGSADVGIIHGERGTQYAFPVQLADGRKAILKGGKRLLNAVQKVVLPTDGTVTIKVTATGQAGTLAREWTVSKV